MRAWMPWFSDVLEGVGYHNLGMHVPLFGMVSNMVIIILWCGHGSAGVRMYLPTDVFRI